MALPARAGAARYLAARRATGPRSRCFCLALMQARRWPVRLPHNRRPLSARAASCWSRMTQGSPRRHKTCCTTWASTRAGPAPAFVENDPKLALVMSDIVIPGGVSGLDLARTLRDRRPELPVILTTGYSSHISEVVVEGFALIEKPYRSDVLAASLRSALEKRGPSRSETLTGF